MGMFDDVDFEHRMPDGFLALGGYQSKDLDCAGDCYEITADGRLVATSRSGYQSENPKPLGDVHYDGVLNIYGSEWPSLKPHEYDLSFVAGELRVIRCSQTGVEVVFEPKALATMQNDSAQAQPASLDG